ncbi:microtubule integrity protein mal3 [Entomophthora muscae]|uniref:Microtubule integrity protein mal3 n=2 Tax=Entomophthora muscae TaxID=34485 RepID=A0ACC2UHY7_9FUNG|nr:microtubule integrity protein mal3 [Entomophthora muscae]KAJ9086367.1 microtubule integrity protein mal3 [Entomophthora muscae]
MDKKAGRVELLMWLNELLQLSYTKLEEAGTGAAYCQILDSVYGDIPLTRVRFNATLEHEFITNYKILQQCFDKHKIKKEIPVQKLIKKQFADNYDFMSWMKRFWEQNYQGGVYNALELRNTKSRIGSRMQSPKPAVTSISNNPYGRAKQNPSQRTTKQRINSPVVHSNFGASPLLQRTHTNVTELMKNVTRIEGERDYYYTKLREVESLYNELLRSSPSPQVSKVLDRLQLILFSQETASERAALSPIPINSTASHENGISETLPNMLSAVNLDDALQLGAAEIDEVETF